jgi:hypothetical protein
MYLSPQSLLNLSRGHTFAKIKSDSFQQFFMAKPFTCHVGDSSQILRFTSPAAYESASDTLTVGLPNRIRTCELYDSWTVAVANTIFMVHTMR